jgi:hypothetical protein
MKREKIENIGNWSKYPNYLDRANGGLGLYKMYTL